MNFGDVEFPGTVWHSIFAGFFFTIRKKVHLKKNVTAKIFSAKIIVNKGIWLWSSAKSFVLFLLPLLALTVHKQQQVLNFAWAIATNQ